MLENIANINGGIGMRASHWLVIAALGAVLGCAAIQGTPSNEERKSLAPTGKLRVGFLLNNPNHATKDPATGELKGVSIDLGKEAARRLGVPFEGVGYPSVPAFEASAATGQWDIAFFGANAARAKLMDFSPPYMEVEVGYLVPAGSAISHLSEVDRPGIRIAVVGKGAVDAYLSRSIENAVVTRAPVGSDPAELVKAGKADTFASLKPFLYRAAEKMPGSRVLEGRLFAEQLAVAVPKGREASMAYARRFVEDVKSTGFVRNSIDRAGLRGVVVAPLQ
jgi:polar amino acid transport system substrate-binding protein